MDPAQPTGVESGIHIVEPAHPRIEWDEASSDCDTGLRGHGDHKPEGFKGSPFSLACLVVSCLLVPPFHCFCSSLNNFSQAEYSYSEVS